jgi:acyl-CoA hydrolase
MDLTPKRASESATEMVQVVLPNDANALGFVLGGTVMHLIDIAGAIAGHRHTRSLLVTAAVDELQFLHPIKVGDLIILTSRVTCAFTTSIEVEVQVHSEATLTGERVPPLVLDTEQERQMAEDAHARRAHRLARKAAASAPTTTA